jgi:hypothetical protein
MAASVKLWSGAVSGSRRTRLNVRGNNPAVVNKGFLDYLEVNCVVSIRGSTRADNEGDHGNQGDDDGGAG